MTFSLPSVRVRRKYDPERNEPSQEDIRRATAAIRERWSPQKRLSRARKSVEPMTVPETPSLAARSGYRLDTA